MANLKNEVTAAEAANTEAATAAEDAKALAEQAQAAHDAVEESIRQGDDTIMPEDLDKSRGLLRFAKLRQEAADRKAAATAAAKEVAQVRLAVDDAVKRARGLPESVPALDKMRDAAVVAVRDYLNAASTMHESLRAAALAIGNAAPKASELGVPTPSDEGITVEPDRIVVESRGKRVSVELADFTLRSAARELLERTNIAEFGFGGDARLTREMRDTAWPANAERFEAGAAA